MKNKSNNVPGVAFAIVIFVFMLNSSMHANHIALHKVGQWGGGRYIDVFVKDGYAYCASDRGGLDIIRVSDPANPVKAGHLDLPGETRDVTVQGNYAYVTVHGSGSNDKERAGLHVIDITNPSFPVPVGYRYFKWMRTVFLNESYAYVLAGQQMVTLDVANPLHPTEISLFDLGGFPMPSNYHSFWGLDIEVKGDCAFVMESVAYGPTDYDDYSELEIIDISNPARPKSLSRFIPSSRSSLVYPSAVAVKDNIAYFLTEYSLVTIDVSNPRSPKELGVCTDCGSDNYFIGDLKVKGNYAYLASGDNMEIVDISNPRVPELKSSIGQFIRKYSELGVTGVYLAGDRAFLATNSAGLNMVDVVDPVKPREIGRYDRSGAINAMTSDGQFLYVARDVKGLQIVNASGGGSLFLAGGIDTAMDALDVKVSGNHAYVAVEEQGLYVYDIADPASPVLTGTWTPASGKTITNVSLTGSILCAATQFDGFYLLDVSNPSEPLETAHYDTYARDVVVAAQGDILFFANRYSSTVTVFDISDPASPTVLQEFKPDSPRGYFHHMTLKGNYAYIAARGYGLMVLDISNPSALKVIARLQLGNYSEYISISGNTLYMADNYEGLKIVDISNPSEPKLLTEYSCDAHRAVERDGYIYMTERRSGIVTVLKSYMSSNTPVIQLDRAGLSFSVQCGAPARERHGITPSFSISNSGKGQLMWTLSADRPWLSCSPSSGSGPGAIYVSVDATGLAPGIHYAAVTVSDPLAINSPLTLPVLVRVYDNGTSSPPFGLFEGPAGENPVYGSVPLTGWALDEMGIQSVEIFRKQGRSMVYVGDAFMVDGARPDIEQRYPWYPGNYRAGWGYLLLTNTLPGGGNGTYTLYAVATDLEGNQTVLGSKELIVDNASSTVPFGAIDTPGPGEVVSGTRYIQSGWALTPPPHTIPFDGSTITVWVDGLPVGHPQYDVYRKDIAELFPGYANSGGAVGHFFLDTTAFDNGLHTIAWSVEDDGGNREGVGSRYFWIDNPGSGDSGARPGGPVYRNYGNIPEWKGGLVEMKELETLRLRIADVRAGYMLMGDILRPLPPGSTLDIANEVFSWQPGAGVKGRFILVFDITEAGNTRRETMNIVIHSRF